MADVSALRARVERIADAALAAAVDTECRLLDQVVPVGAGPNHAGPNGERLIDSRQVESAGRLAVVIRYPGPIANYLDAGTGPHIIRPRSGRALAFVWPGGPPALAANRAQSFFVLDHVNHPGSTKHVGWWSRYVNEDVWRRVLGDAVADAIDRDRG